jgi:hypothetical protein
MSGYPDPLRILLGQSLSPTPLLSSSSQWAEKGVRPPPGTDGVAARSCTREPLEAPSDVAYYRV